MPPRPLCTPTPLLQKGQEGVKRGSRGGSREGQEGVTHLEGGEVLVVEEVLRQPVRVDEVCVEVGEVVQHAKVQHAAGPQSASRPK
eukprot:2384476-Pyramimonas_sp.AAC.1